METLLPQAGGRGSDEKDVVGAAGLEPATLSLEGSGTAHNSHAPAVASFTARNDWKSSGAG